ncbi:MAG: hypothetical protein GEU89_10185 [Kiloniellaceae bacterium]|nr:hypothetical protein [Kiloniellaceae bacterium]
MTHTLCQADDAAAAARRLSVSLVNSAHERCDPADLDNVDDCDSLLALIDWSSRRLHGQPLRDLLRAAAAQAGIALPEEADGPSADVEGLVLQSMQAGADRLAELRAAAMPSLGEAIQRAVAWILREREHAESSGLFEMLLEAGRNRDARKLEELAALERSTDPAWLTQLGMVIRHGAYPAIPATPAEWAAARQCLQDLLLLQVRERISTYWHPCGGRVELASATLSPHQEAEVRAAAESILGLG